MTYARHVSKHNWPEFWSWRWQLGDEYSKSVHSVAADVVAGPPLVPESAMGKANDHCVARFLHLETLHVQIIYM
jgi:hypothetical protein